MFGPKNNRTVVRFKYCTTTGNAELEVDAANPKVARRLLDEYMVKFFDIYMLKIIDVMQKTNKEMNKLLETVNATQASAQGNAACGGAGPTTGSPDGKNEHQPADPNDPAYN